MNHRTHAQNPTGRKGRRAAFMARLLALACLALPLAVAGQTTVESSPPPNPTPRPPNNPNYTRYSNNPSGSSSSSSRFSPSRSSRSSRSDRDRDSASRSSGSSSSSSSKTTVKPGGPGPSSPAPGQKTILRSAPVRSGGAAKVIKSSGGSGKTALSPFQLRVDNSATVLYLDPPDTTVAKGDTFKTDVMLSNPTGNSFIDVRLALRYDRDVLKPLSYADKSLKPYLMSPSRLEVHPRLGVLVYTAQLHGPFTNVTAPLIEIKWEAMQLANRAEVYFVSYDQKPSGLWFGKEDILGNPENPNDGFINASAQVLPPDMYALFKQGRRRAGQGGEIEEISLNQLPATIGGVQLSLLGPTSPVQVGDTFQVDVHLDNSADSYVDRIDLVLQYDPDILDVLDTDHNNWIVRGTNILDGPYHATFPFDYHIENQVYAARGEVVYRMGITDPEKLRHRVGTMATVTFRAKAPAPRTKVAFRLPEHSFSPGTKLRYLDESVLGTSDATARSGLRDLSLRVMN